MTRHTQYLQKILTNQEFKLLLENEDQWKHGKKSKADYTNTYHSIVQTAQARNPHITIENFDRHNTSSTSIPSVDQQKQEVIRKYLWKSTTEEKRRDMLFQYPWLGEKLAEIKQKRKQNMISMQRKEQERMMRQANQKTIERMDFDRIPLIGYQPLKNKVSMLLQKEKMMKPSEEVFNFIYAACEKQMLGTLTELLDIAKYRDGVEVAQIYETEISSLDNQSHIAQFHNKKGFSTISVDKQMSTSKKKSANSIFKKIDKSVEDVALANLGQISRRSRKRRRTAPSVVPMKQRVKITDNVSYRKNTITPLDVKYYLNTIPQLADTNSTRESLMIDHLDQ